MNFILEIQKITQNPEFIVQFRDLMISLIVLASVLIFMFLVGISLKELKVKERMFEVINWARCYVGVVWITILLILK